MTVPARAPSCRRIRVPATAANLGPGFDCIGLALQRYLTLTMNLTDKPGAWEMTLSGSGADRLPRDRTNLIYRSTLIGAGMGGERLPGLRVRVTNEIPLARGQGSSAAAIVAGIAAGQLLACGEIDRAKVIAQASPLEGHSDNIAASVLGGLVLTREADGAVRTRRVPTADGALFVAAVPEFELTTCSSRAVLPEDVPLSDAAYNIGAIAWLSAAWAAGDWSGVAEAMDDRLHQPYRASLIPGFDEVCAAAREAGALAACLSGSGPTILALAPDRADSVAQAMEAAWRKFGVASRAGVMNIDTEGLVVTSDDD